MLVEAQYLQAIAVSQIGVAPDDQVVFIVAVARSCAEVVAAADNDGCVSREVGDDGFEVHQQVAFLALQSFLHPAFQPFREQGGGRELGGTIGVKSGDAACRVLYAVTQDIVMVGTEQRIEDRLGQRECGGEQQILVRTIDHVDELGKIPTAGAWRETRE